MTEGTGSPWQGCADILVFWRIWGSWKSIMFCYNKGLGGLNLCSWCASWPWTSAPPFGWNCHHAAGMTGQVTKRILNCLWHSVRWQLDLGQLYYRGWSSKLQHVRNCFITSLDTFAVERVFIPRGEKEAATSSVPCRHLIFICTLDLMLLTAKLQASCINDHCWD